MNRRRAKSTGMATDFRLFGIRFINKLSIVAAAVDVDTEEAS